MNNYLGTENSEAIELVISKHSAEWIRSKRTFCFLWTAQAQPSELLPVTSFFCLQSLKRIAELRANKCKKKCSKRMNKEILSLLLVVVVVFNFYTMRKSNCCHERMKVRTKCGLTKQTMQTTNNVSSATGPEKQEYVPYEFGGFKPNKKVMTIAALCIIVSVVVLSGLAIVFIFRSTKGSGLDIHGYRYTNVTTVLTDFAFSKEDAVACSQRTLLLDLFMQLHLVFPLCMLTLQFPKIYSW